MESRWRGWRALWLTYRLALGLGREPFEAWAAGVVLLGTGYFLKYANHAMFDVILTALFLCALLALSAGVGGERVGLGRWWGCAPGWACSRRACWGCSRCW